MIVKSIQKNVVESHDFKSEIATIDASEMRYISSLLRNNYSDTILATVRETWANAVDANAAAKSSTPIKISFPTVLAPTYSVRDFGTGLSEQELFGLYTKYGRSSKRGDNSAIGGFGIGRFSPLSYTDSFTVVSCKDGEKIIISVYVDARGRIYH
jgi:HSP90 family molecular chaperone